MTMSKKSFMKIVMLFMGLCIIFLLFPEIDLWVAGLFYDPQKGFYLQDQAFITFLYRSITFIVAVFTLVLLVVLSIQAYHRRQIQPFFSQKKLIYLFLVLLIGPGLIVNTVLKEHWGRARPMDIQQFNGEKTFSRPFIPVNQCKSNCSFTSGHAAAGFFLLVFGFIFPRKRNLFFFQGIFWGFFSGFLRILQGKHFLSDVIFLGFLVYFTAWLIYHAIFATKDVDDDTL